MTVLRLVSWLRRKRWARVLWGVLLSTIGGATLVYAAMFTVVSQGAEEKVKGIVLAVMGVWVLSRGGAALYGMLFAR